MYGSTSNRPEDEFVPENGYDFQRATQMQSSKDASWPSCRRPFAEFALIVPRSSSRRHLLRDPIHRRGSIRCHAPAHGRVLWLQQGPPFFSWIESLEGPASKRLSPLRYRSLGSARCHDPTDQIFRQGGRNIVIGSSSLGELNGPLVAAQVGGAFVAIG
jgi:hypothetical protein